MGTDGSRQGAIRDETGWDATALEEWVAHVAADQELAENEVVDRMLSALWILDEVESLMEDTDGSQLPGLDLSAVTDATDSDAATAGSSDESIDPPDAAHGGGVDPGVLLGVVEALRGDDDGDAESGTTIHPARVDARLDSVVDDVAALSSRVDRIDEQTDAATDADHAALAGAVDALEDRLDERAAAVDARLEEHDTALEEHATQLQEHDETLEDHGDSLGEHDGDIESHAETLSAFGDTLCKHADRLSAAEETLDDQGERLDSVAETSDSVASAHEELQAAYEENFDNVDVALRFLVDRTDEVSDSVEELEAALSAERRERRRREDERRRLADLRHELANHGVTRAACESCQSEVDVSCLLQPRCPHCDRPFDGHRRRGGVFGLFATDELTTTQRGPRMRSGARDSTRDRTLAPSLDD